MKFIDARNALIIDGDDVVSNLVTIWYGKAERSSIWTWKPNNI